MLNDYISREILIELSSHGLFNPKDIEAGISIIAEKTKNKIFPMWQTEDIILRGKDKKILISEEHALIILNNLERHHDASIGITWDSIDAEIEAFIKGDH